MIATPITQKISQKGKNTIIRRPYNIKDTFKIVNQHRTFSKTDEIFFIHVK